MTNFGIKKISIASIVIIVFLVFIENAFVAIGNNLTVSDTMWMLVLININIIVLMLLILLVFRHIIKLFYDRKRKVMGARLRTRIVIAFIFLSLLPSVVFLFPIKFINTSVEYWFNTPVLRILKNSINICKEFNDYVYLNHLVLHKNILKKMEADKLFEFGKRNDLCEYLKHIQENNRLDAVSVCFYDSLKPVVLVFRDGLDCSLRKKIILSQTTGMGKVSVENFSDIKLFHDEDLIHTVSSLYINSDLSFNIICSFFVEPNLYKNISEIDEAFKDYNSLLTLRKQIQITCYVILLVVAFFVVFCAIWFGFYLAKTIITPIMKLLDGTRRIADGDLNFAIEKTTYDDEIGGLVDSFNKMISDFLASQRQLELSAKKLKEQNQEIEERRRYMEIVLKSVSTGVITLDADGYITTFNTSAEKMLSLDAKNILNCKYNKLFNSKKLKFIGEILDSLDLNGGQTFEIPLRMTINGVPRSFLVSVNALEDEKDQHMGVVMVFDDLTELEKAQRMAAWREVARRIAHEVKNPLTPIILSAQRLRRKYSEQIDEPIFVECICMIIDHVTLIRNLVNEFSTFARFPAANPKLSQIAPMIEETVALYREGHEKVDFDIAIENNLPKMSIDRQQIKQAMINIVNNAIVALKNEGCITIKVSFDKLLKLVRIEIADNGVGIKNEDKIMLFEPNFSTKKSGMGLGLTIVNTIVTDHNGIIRVQDNKPSGAKFVIELPV